MEMNVQHARDNLSRLIAAAEAGEDVVITRRGKPAIRLVPVRPETGRWGGRDLDGFFEEGASFRGRRSSVDIEAEIVAERDAWD